MAESPLADALAASVLAVSGFCAVRLGLGTLWRRATARDVDIVHMVMGVSMAGMLTGWLSGAWDTAWLIVFSASGLWFGWGVVSQLSRAVGANALASRGSEGPRLSHFLASVVMVYMMTAMRWAMSGTDMATMAHGSGIASPVLPDVLAGLLVVDALLALVWCRRMIPARVPLVSPSITSPDGGRMTDFFVAAQGGPSQPLLPKATPACLLVMSFSMAYMIITVRP